MLSNVIMSLNKLSFVGTYYFVVNDSRFVLNRLLLYRYLFTYCSTNEIPPKLDVGMTREFKDGIQINWPNIFGERVRMMHSRNTVDY